MSPFEGQGTSISRRYLNSRKIDTQLWQKVDTLKLSYGEKIDAVIEAWGLPIGAKARLAREVFGVSPRSVSRFLSGEFPASRRRDAEIALGLEGGWLDLDWDDLNALKRSLAERREAAAILGRVGFRPEVYGGSIDGEGTPKPISDPEGVAMHVGNVVTKAIQRMIDKNEMWYEGQSRDDLIEALHLLAAEFTRRKIDTEDLDIAIAFLRRRDKQPPKGR